MDKLILKTVFVSYVPLFFVLPVEASDIASAAENQGNGAERSDDF